MPLLYRLFAACVMLRSVVTRNRGQPHNYPKMQMANLMVMEYWRQIDHVSRKMAEDNMALFNEELGEITFSILSLMAPWPECVSGQFAVVQAKWNQGNGVKVVKIMEVIGERRHQQPDGTSEVWNVFVGREWISTVDNTTIECLKHPWYHQPANSTDDDVLNYEVIAYLPRLLPGNLLSPYIQTTVREMHSRKEIFRNFAMHGNPAEGQADSDYKHV